MNEKKSWNAIKQDLWKEDRRTLEKHLKELEAHKIKTDTFLAMGQAKRMNAHSAKSYFAGKKKDITIGDPKQIRKRIACLKTIINQRWPEHGTRKGIISK